MKRSIAFFLAVICALHIVGCGKKNSDPVNNEVFTEMFFAEVVQMRYILDDPISGEQMEPVIRYLKGLHLAHTDEELPTEKEPKYGGWDLVYMEFIKADGTSLMIRLNQWAMSGLPGGSYYVEDYREAIERGDKSLLCSLWEACGRDPETYPFFV